MENENSNLSETTEGEGTGGRSFLASKITVGWKITSVIIVVFVMLAVFNILFIRHRISGIMEAEFLSKAKAIAFSLASASENNLVSGNLGVIQSLVDGFSGIQGVRYVFVTNDKGKVVAHTFKGVFPDSIVGLNKVFGDKEFSRIDFQDPAVGRIMEVSVPILFGVAGTGHVGMNRDLITDEMGEITTRLILQFAGAFIIGVILLHLVVKFLLRHMKPILDVLEKAGNGDFSGSVDVFTRDEFGILGERINATLEGLGGMIHRVRQSFDSISLAGDRMSRLYKEILEGTEQQAGLAAETLESVTHNRKMITEVTNGIHVLEGSANDSFSSIMEMGASVEEVSAMADSQSRSVNESNAAIEDMSSSISAISDNLLALSQATEETASSMSEMGVSIQQVRQNAETTSEDAVLMTRIAEEGVNVSRSAMEGTLAIRESSSQVSRLISVVTERIEEIDEILSFITDITGKTNLLALNAAIIAAQAGAQGKGFGVVADEINELAQSTKAQTNRIAGVIQGIREEVSRTGEAVEDAHRKVENGVQLSERVTDSLEKILQSTNLVSQRVDEIAQTTSEQTMTSTRVMEATDHLSGSVNNIKEAGQKQSQSGDKLLEMSRRIQQMADKIKMSTEEQSTTSKQINKDLTMISETVREISVATDVQAANGDKVQKLTENLTGIVEANRRSVHGLQGVISELDKRMGLLQNELKVFVVKDD